MKKILSLFAVILMVASISFAQTTLFEDDFEGFTVGDFVNEADVSGFWDTWSGGAGTAEDAVISNDQNNTDAGANSMLVDGTNDMVLLLGNETTGEFTLSVMYYIETGFGGYINFQHSEEMGQEWAFELMLDENGTGELTANGTTTACTYPKDQWFEIFCTISVETDEITLTVDGTDILTWQFSLQADGTPGTNRLGAVNIYAGAPAEQTAKYYVDDIEYIQTLAPVEHAELELSATEFTLDGLMNETLTLSNTGAEDMTFDALVYYPSPVAKSALTTNNSTTTTTTTTTKVVRLNSISSTKLDKPIELNLDEKDATLTHNTGAMVTSIGWNSTENVDVQSSALFKYDNNATAGVDIKDYIGMELASVIIFCGALPVDGSSQVEIFEGRDGIFSGPKYDATTTEIFTPNADGQASVTLTDPVFISGKDLFVGWGFTQLAGENYCIAVDSDTPTAAEGANWLKNGPSWSEFSDYGNLGIVAMLTGEAMHQWLTLDLTQGVIAPDGTQDVTLQFDIAGMETGNYLSTVTIKTNDDDDEESYVEIPVNLTLGTGISGTEHTSIATYPNPTSDFFNVVANENINQINVLNISGQMVKNISVNTNTYKVNTSDLQAGIYFFEITTNNQTITKKVIVK